MKRLLVLGALAFGSLITTSAQADDGHRHANRGGGYGYSSGQPRVYGNTFNGGYSYGSYSGFGNYSGYGSGYGYGGNYGNNGWGNGGWYSQRPSYYHDTSHWDYHPPTVYQHGNHFHYQPGHYDYHQTGHWHR